MNKMRDTLLSKFLWWRKLRGGHWEKWRFGIDGSPTQWLRMQKCTGFTSENLACESHGTAMDLDE